MIPPTEGDGVLVDLRQILLQPRDEFGLGLDPEMSEKDLIEFGKEDFEEIQPRAVLGREDEFEAIRAGGPRRLGFPRDMRGVGIEHDRDFGARVVLGIQGLQKRHKLAASGAVADPPEDLAGGPVNAGQQLTEYGCIANFPPASEKLLRRLRSIGQHKRHKSAGDIRWS